jgi:hypothetical protein
MKMEKNSSRWPQGSESEDPTDCSAQSGFAFLCFVRVFSGLRGEVDKYSVNETLLMIKVELRRGGERERMHFRWEGIESVRPQRFVAVANDAVVRYRVMERETSPTCLR